MELAALLRKEQTNSYGILAPPAPAPAAGCSAGNEDDAECERVLRGSAMYVRASLINHECNPNVARFDAFDAGGPASTHVTFRAMHDLPPGTPCLTCTSCQAAV